MASLSIFQPQIRDITQQIALDAAAILAKIVNTPGSDPEFILKIFREVKDVAQAVPERGLNAGANLPVFHIHMLNGRNGGGLVGTHIEAPKPIFDIDAVEVPEPMSAFANINLEVIGQDSEEGYVPDASFDVASALDALMDSMPPAPNDAPRD